MEENSSSFTPEQSLELIGRFILNYRKNLRGNSFYFLLWGWLIILASVSHFIILTILIRQEAFNRIGLASLVNWIIFPALGMILTAVHARKDHIKNSFRSHVDKFIGTLWQVSALTIVMMIFFCIKIKYPYPTPFILTVVGMATLITGLTIKFRPLVYGGIVFFAAAVISSFIANEYQLLINAVALALGYLIPGYMLRASKID